MSDITTFSKWKDWLLITLVGFVITLLGLVASENRQRIDKLEQENRETRIIRQNGFERLRAVEEQIRLLNRDVDRILDREERRRRGNTSSNSTNDNAVNTR